MELRNCPQCGPDVLFEQVRCVDGHDDDCPDRVCTGCATVLAVGPVPLRAAVAVAA